MVVIKNFFSNSLAFDVLQYLTSLPNVEDGGHIS